LYFILTVRPIALMCGQGTVATPTFPSLIVSIANTDDGNIIVAERMLAIAGVRMAYVINRIALRIDHKRTVGHVVSN
jgi:hypothetical protein